MNPAMRQPSRYGWRPADPPGRPVLFVNPRSGDGKAARAGVAERARAKGIEAVILTPGQDLAALAREAVAADADALGMAGGDGWLAVVAAAAAAHRIPFVCVPAGTRNHFALDVGVDRHDVIGALDAFTGGTERRIDTAKVNGRMFLNNVSLGIYGAAVRRPACRDAKVRTLLETAAEVMGPSAEAPALRLADDLGPEHRHPAVVLVSNNPYALDRQLARGTRPALDGSQLGIVVVDAPGGSPRSLGRAWSAPRIEVSAPEPVHAGVDGEAVDLEPPLRFAIRPASLRVRICPLHPGASPSALLNLTAQPPRAVPPAPEARVESVMQNRLASAGLWGLHERSVQVSGQQPQRVLRITRTFA
jgi:diacylglycerol kinase family enzyme